MSSDASGSDEDAIMQIEASEELELPDEPQSPFLAHGSSREEDGACEAVQCLQQDAAGPSNEKGAREVGRRLIVTPSYFAAVLLVFARTLFFLLTERFLSLPPPRRCPKS